MGKATKRQRSTKKKAKEPASNSPRQVHRLFTTVKVPLMDDRVTGTKVHQLDRVTARDTTVIKRYLEIIQAEEKELWREGKEHEKIDRNKLDALTLTSKPLARGDTSSLGRSNVKYDLKKEFGHKITVRELKECRDTAVELWHGYQDRVKKHEETYWKIMKDPKYIDRADELVRVLHWWKTKKRPTPPCQAEDYRPRKLPRRATLGTTAEIHVRATKLTNYWLELYYSVEKGENKRTCDRLWLPLNCSCYHVNMLKLGSPKTVQLVKHLDTDRWYAHLAVKIEVDIPVDQSKPLAVVGLDPGIAKALVAVLITENRDLSAKDIRVFEQQEKKRVIIKLDNLIGSLQRKLASYKSKKGKNVKNINRKLKHLRRKRHKLAVQYDNELTAQITRWIKQLEHTYTVYVALGNVKGIRQTRRKGDGKSCKHRRELHQWAFARLNVMLQAKLLRAGIPPARFRAVKESWTSKTCSKCGSTDTYRPFQALIICQTCDTKLQADINGATNIAMKLILSLDEASLDQWLKKPFLEQQRKKRNVRLAGRKRSCTRSPSSISSPPSGDETPASVSRGVEPASRRSGLEP
ncbi:MAG: zinc ribbon domain-containing protein [Candidatus Hermodarchaeota archaeon]